MPNYKVFPPKQRFMSLAAIYDNFGERAVLAYRCREDDNVPKGGYIIAVQKEPGTPTGDLWEYMSQLRKRYPNKEPIYFMCVRRGESGQLSVSYAGGGKGQRPTPTDKTQKIPDEDAAKAVSTVLHQEGQV